MFPNSSDLFVWVLAPSVQTDDPNIAYYYDFSQSIEEFTIAFKELSIEWKWQEVTMQNYKAVIDIIALKRNGKKNLVFNLCDGDEINGGCPGISVVRYLNKKRVVYTGADEYFYNTTTSKIFMKDAFDKANVSNSPWFPITDKEFHLNGEFHQLAKPVIVKPAVSAGSIGLGVRNVVHTEEELKAIIEELYHGYRGWDLATGGFVVESFIKGQEFTSFIIGSHIHPEKAVFYNPVERVFHQNLSDEEKFLSFDRLWEFYEGEKPINDFEDFYKYKPVTGELAKEINKLSWEAFASVGGTGYARIDLRRDQTTGQLYLLEVNAQCGLSEDEDFTSIGAILRFNNESYSQMCLKILDEAFCRHTQKTKISKKVCSNKKNHSSILKHSNKSLS